MAGKNNECTITWTDEDGRIGIYGMFNFTRALPCRGGTFQQAIDAGRPAERFLAAAGDEGLGT